MFVSDMSAWSWLLNRRVCALGLEIDVPKVALALVGFFLATAAASAQCPSFTNILNGSTADAAQVMNNFNYILQCPNFTGNVGIGTAVPLVRLDVGPVSAAPQTVSAGAAGLIRNSAPADSAPYTQARFIVYGGPGVDGGNWAYLSYGSDASLREVYAKTGAGGPLYWGTSSAMDGTGMFTSTMVLTPSGHLGIGTSSPSAVLDAFSNSNAQVARLTGGTNDNTQLIIAGHLDGDLWAVGSDIQGGGTTGDFEIYNWGHAGGSPGTKLTILGNGNVGVGTAAPSQRLEVNGQVQIDALASAASTPLCINGSVVSSCSSSLRYKKDVRNSEFGLSEVMAMRPVIFKWKGRDETDFGLIAEEVAKIDPLFVTYKNGKIEGVKYPQLVSVLIGAIREQQRRLIALEKQNRDIMSREAHEAVVLKEAISSMRRARFDRVSQR
jgi:hypothetical protein